MEKGTPHCKLAHAQALVTQGKYRTTNTARTGAAKLGLGVDEMVAVVLALTRKDFDKSMTTHADHTIWQDVYKPNTAVGPVYLKLTVVADVLIVSFKVLGT